MKEENEQRYNEKLLKIKSDFELLHNEKEALLRSAEDRRIELENDVER